MPKMLIAVLAVLAVAVAAVAGLMAWQYHARPGAQIVIRLDPRAVQGGDARAAMQAYQGAVQDRADVFGWRPQVRIDGDRFVIDIAHFADLAALRRAFGPRPVLELRMVDENVFSEHAMPAGEEALGYFHPIPGYPPFLAVHRVSLLGGTHIADARGDFDYRDGKPIVSVRFDSEGAKQFARLTRRSVGKRIAIVLDGRIVAAPKVLEPITGGSMMIQGNFTAQESQDLAATIAASSGPDWPFTVVSVTKVER